MPHARTWYAALILVLLIAFHARATDREPITILCSPGPFASIVQAAGAEEHVNFHDDDASDDDACTECFAATELHHFLAQSLQQPEASIRLIPAKELPREGDIILLGSRRSNALIASLDPPPPEFEKTTNPQAFRLHAMKRDGRRLVVIEGRGRIGVLYGAYALLEKMGLRFFGLGEKGTVFPQNAAALPDDLNTVEAPGFDTRGFLACSPRGNETFFLWMARNRMNLWIAGEKRTPLLKKLGVKLSEGGHIVQNKFLGPQLEYPYHVAAFAGSEGKPADPYPPSPQYLGDANHDGRLSYAEVHPEWYAQHGKRRDAHLQKELRYNFCTSNESARLELAKNLVASLIDGDYRDVDTVDMFMLDHGPWCDCPACREQGSFTDRMLSVQNTISQAIRAARRDGRLKRNVQVSSLAYLETLPPPTRPLPDDFDYANCFVTFYPISRCYAHPLADPACTEINLHTFECYNGWTQDRAGFYHGHMTIGEYYNVSSIKSLPVLYTHIMAADIPWYYRSGVRQLQYMHTPTSLWGTWTLNQYLLGKLLWNPDAKVQQILDDYFQRYYPTTTARTRQFYEHLEYAMSNVKAFKHHVWTGGEAHYCLPGMLDSRKQPLFPLEHLHEEAYHPPINDAPDMVEIVAAMAQARRTIDAAIGECRDDTERSRLQEDERRFAYGEAMVLFLHHLARTQLFDQSGDQSRAREEFKSVETMAERLRHVTDLVQVAYRHANAKDGLEASQADPAYDFYRKKFGISENRQSRR